MGCYLLLNTGLEIVLSVEIVHFIIIDIFIYYRCHVCVLINKEMYNHLLLKTNFCF